MSDKPSPQHVRGSLKEALGKITGDPETEAQGRAEKQAERNSTKNPRNRGPSKATRQT
ncbi:hypothetical protein GCM10007886_46130 [Methylobacterium gregans]|nr:hypothetical protein GCM10007886_46130 [Methylobacterium gregans]